MKDVWTYNSNGIEYQLEIEYLEDTTFILESKRVSDWLSGDHIRWDQVNFHAVSHSS